MTPDERERFEREVLHHEKPSNAPAGPAREPGAPTQPTSEHAEKDGHHGVDTEQEPTGPSRR